MAALACDFYAEEAERATNCRTAGRTSFANLNEQILTAAGIYGANASGKTNVLLALAWLAQADG